MNDRYFLDTNIIIYSFDDQNPAKKSISQRLIKAGIEQHHTSISYQVIQEFINVSTQKFSKPLSPTDTKFYLRKVLTPLWHVYPSKELIVSAIDIQEKWKYSFYDSLIIAAALESSATVLFSEDLQHGQQIETLQIIDPFRD